MNTVSVWTRNRQKAEQNLRWIGRTLEGEIHTSKLLCDTDLVKQMSKMQGTQWKNPAERSKGAVKKGSASKFWFAAKIQKSKARNTDESVDSFDFSILCTNTLLHPWVTKQEKLALLVSLSRSHRPASLHPHCVSPLAPMLLITLPTLLSFRLFSSSIISLLRCT